MQQASQFANSFKPAHSDVPSFVVDFIVGVHRAYKILDDTDSRALDEQRLRFLQTASALFPGPIEPILPNGFVNLTFLSGLFTLGAETPLFPIQDLSDNMFDEVLAVVYMTLFLDCTLAIHFAVPLSLMGSLQATHVFVKPVHFLPTTNFSGKLHITPLYWFPPMVSIPKLHQTAATGVAVAVRTGNLPG